jgi:glycosyltransferase involved in cell wall biosynthesis
MKFCFWGDISGALQGRNLGGGELQIALLAKALALKGHEVVIVDPYSKKSFITEEGVQLIHVPEWNKGVRGVRLFWNRIPALWKLFVAQKADYYYVRMRSYLHLIPFFAARKNKSRFLVGIASDIDVLSFKKKIKHSYKGNISLFRLLLINTPNDIAFRYLLKQCDLAVLQHQGQHFGSALLQNRQAVFPNVIKPILQPSPDTDNRIKKYFLYAGDLTMLKGADRLLKLIQMVDDSIAFKIVGRPLGYKPVKIYDELKGIKNVELLGKKNHAETLQLISSARAVINTSYFEGFSNVFLESWSCGVPVISLEVNPGAIFKKYELGVCCNGDLNRMKAIIESGETDSMDKNKMISYISAFHHFDTAAERFLDLLNKHV